MAETDRLTNAKTDHGTIATERTSGIWSILFLVCSLTLIVAPSPSSPSARESDPVIRKAERLHDRGRTDEAVALLEEALSERPDELRYLEYQLRFFAEACGHEELCLVEARKLADDAIETALGQEDQSYADRFERRFSSVNRKLERHDYELASSEGTRSTLAEFLVHHPDGDHFEEVERRVYDLDVEMALAPGTVEAYEAFLNSDLATRYPERERLRQETMNMAFAQADSENNVYAWMSFFERYGGYDRDEEATDRLTKAVERVKSPEVLLGYLEFCTETADEYCSFSSQDVEARIYEIATSPGEETTYAKYIQSCEESGREGCVPWVEVAYRDLLAIYSEVGAVSSAQAYVKNYPDSPFHDEAFLACRRIVDVQDSNLAQPIDWIVSLIEERDRSVREDSAERGAIIDRWERSHPFTPCSEFETTSECTAREKEHRASRPQFAPSSTSLDVLSRADGIAFDIPATVNLGAYDADRETFASLTLVAGYSARSKPRFRVRNYADPTEKRIGYKINPERLRHRRVRVSLSPDEQFCEAWIELEDVEGPYISDFDYHTRWGQMEGTGALGSLVATAGSIRMYRKRARPFREKQEIDDIGGVIRIWFESTDGWQSPGKIVVRAQPRLFSRSTGEPIILPPLFDKDAERSEMTEYRQCPREKRKQKILEIP